MPETATLTARKPYGILAFWGIHTLMLALFLLLESAGFKMPVGSSIFYFAWIAVWIMHGLSLVLMHIRDREQADGDATSERRFRWRMVLGAHSALYMAFGPAVLLWWLTARPPGPQQPGEGQGLWIYPVWLLLLLAHGAYVMMRERQVAPPKVEHKRKRDLPSLKHLMESDVGEVEEWEMDEDDSETKRKR